MRKWHLYKEYITFDNGNKTALKYMALFCTNDDGSYRKHIDIVYNKTSYDIITDIVDGSYFTFIYDLGKPEVQDMVNETDLVKKIQKMFDGSIPETSIRKHRKREFHPEATAGEIFIAIFGEAVPIISLCANNELFDCDNIDIEKNTYKYDKASLVFYEQVELEILYEYVYSFYSINLTYNDLLKYENLSKRAHFGAVAKLMIALIQHKQIKLSFGNNNGIMDMSANFDNIRNNFFEIGSQLSPKQLEMCLQKYFGVHTKDVVSKILEYKKAKNKEQVPENMIAVLFDRIIKFFEKCKIDVNQIFTIIRHNKALVINY